MTAEDFYDKELSKYNLLNLIDPATAEQAMQMMEGYYQAKLKLLGIAVVSKTFTAEEVIKELEESDHLDDSIMHFKENWEL